MAARNDPDLSRMPAVNDPDPYDVAVIGGGPAGSAAASWLARQGARVAQFEKERFPRFHIGESLLPNGNGILKEIGVWEKIEAAGFVEKRGAEFTFGHRAQSVLNVFANGLVPGMEKTYQVERARFDDILFQHARASGSDSRQEAAVAKAERAGSGWVLTIRDRKDATERSVSARWLIDASGRGSLMGRALGLKKEELPYPGRLAVFTHFTGVPRGEGERAGDIIVLRLKDAWFWLIPISDTLTSVGVVAQKGAGPRPGEDRDAFFWRKVGESNWLSEAVGNAERARAFRIESDYSFSYERFGADRVLLAGDAASFIDPVFSSGVYLALNSGLLAAKTIHRELASGRAQTSQRLYRRYTKALKKQVGVMRRLIDAYYDNRAFEVFMTPKPPLALDRAVNAIVAGCLKPPLAVRWRYALFRLACRIHKKRPIAPELDWGKRRP